MSQSHVLTCRTFRVNLRLPNFLVELAYRPYHACVSHAHNLDVNSSALNQREYRTFDVIKSIAIECVRAQQGVHNVSTILGTMMDSRNSKTIEQRRPTQGADWVMIVSVTQVLFLTQTRLYQLVNHLKLTMKVAVNPPPQKKKQKNPIKNNRDHKRVSLHLLYKFVGSSLNRWWVMAWTSSKWGKFGFSS